MEVAAACLPTGYTANQMLSKALTPPIWASINFSDRRDLHRRPRDCTYGRDCTRYFVQPNLTFGHELVCFCAGRLDVQREIDLSSTILVWIGRDKMHMIVAYRIICETLGKAGNILDI